MKNLLLLSLLAILCACSHPLEIVGEGDILSSTGTRNCYLEDFQAGKDSCAVNLVVRDYQETYYAMPRDGWVFASWKNYCTDGSTADQCSFNVEADVVRQFWGGAAQPLVAVFEKSSPPPAPVAMYSYAIDDDGFLIDPLPLEGALLARKVAYFTFTGDFSSASFWCCKVPEGDEAHGDKVEDKTPPFVLRVDLNALPDDAGLQRELYADLFTSATDYTGHSAYWRLERAVLGPFVFDDGGNHLVDYDISTGIRVLDYTSITIAPDITISGPGGVAGEARYSSYITVNGGNIRGEIVVRDGSGIILNEGSIDTANVWDSLDGFTMTGGTVGWLSQLWGNVKISGGHISNVHIYDGQAEISGGMIGSMTAAGSTGVSITGGRFEEKLLFEQKSFGSITGGTFISAIEVLSEAELRLYGELTLTEQTMTDQYSYYTRRVSGTLRDGTPIDNDIKCQFYTAGDIDSSCERVSVYP